MPLKAKLIFRCSKSSVVFKLDSKNIFKKKYLHVLKVNDKMILFVFEIILIFFLAIFRIATHSGYSVKLNDILSSKNLRETQGILIFSQKHMVTQGISRSLRTVSFDSKSGNLAFILIEIIY